MQSESFMRNYFMGSDLTETAEGSTENRVMRIPGLLLLCCSSHMKGFEVYFDGFLGKGFADNLLPEQNIKLLQIE